MTSKYNYIKYAFNSLISGILNAFNRNFDRTVFSHLVKTDQTKSNQHCNQIGKFAEVYKVQK